MHSKLHRAKSLYRACCPESRYSTDKENSGRDVGSARCIASTQHSSRLVAETVFVRRQRCSRTTTFAAWPWVRDSLFTATGSRKTLCDGGALPPVPRLQRVHGAVRSSAGSSQVFAPSSAAGRRPPMGVDSLRLFHWSARKLLQMVEQTGSEKCSEPGGIHGRGHFVCAHAHARAFLQAAL
jgi:hypothetical protein